MTLIGMKVTSSELSVAEAFRMLVPNPIDGKSGKFKRGKDAGKDNKTRSNRAGQQRRRRRREKPRVTRSCSEGWRPWPRADESGQVMECRWSMVVVT